MRILLYLGLATLLSTPCAAEKLKVVAATTDLGALAHAVGRDLIEIDVVARPERDPHTVQVRPSTMRKVAKADFYLEVGLSLDLWSAEVVRGSRNRNLKVLNCSTVIEPLEIPTGKVDASMGDVHPEGNPHYWLDPLNGIAVATFLMNAFSAADPENAEAYDRHTRAFSEAIMGRIPTWNTALKQESFVEFHRSWVYLADRFDMRIVGRVEPLPGIPPTARHLAGLSEAIRMDGVPVVIRDPFHSDSSLEFLERETKIKGYVLPSSCAEPTYTSYLAHFDTIADILGNRPGGDQ